MKKKASLQNFNNPIRRRQLRFTVLALCAMLFALCASAQAQKPNKVPRIGFLSATSSSAIAARVEAFRQGLRELGYVEGRNIVIEWRYAEGKLDRLSELAAELVRLKVNAIVSAGPPITRTAKQTTATIPIVIAMDTDPVGNGFVASLARPGGNITGLSTLLPEIGTKRLELLKEIIPKLSRVATLGTSTSPTYAPAMREIELAAKALKLQVQYLDVLNSTDIETAFRAANNGRAQALLMLGSPVLDSERAHLADRTVENRLPAIYPQVGIQLTPLISTYCGRLGVPCRQPCCDMGTVLRSGLALPWRIDPQIPARFGVVLGHAGRKLPIVVGGVN